MEVVWVFMGIVIGIVGTLSFMYRDWLRYKRYMERALDIVEAERAKKATK